MPSKTADNDSKKLPNRKKDLLLLRQTISNEIKNNKQSGGIKKIIISKIYNKADKETKDALTVVLAVALAVALVFALTGGLTGGLVFALAVALTGGLVFALAVALTVGLAGGLAVGLAGGLAVALAGGLAVILINWSEALPYFTSFYPVLFLIIGIIIISEILFHLMKPIKIKDKKERFWLVLRRKAECIFETLLGFSAVVQVYVLTREIQLRNYFPVILKWIGYIGAGIIALALVVLVIYIWIKLNELRYKK